MSNSTLQVTPFIPTDVLVAVTDRAMRHLSDRTVGRLVGIATFSGAMADTEDVAADAAEMILRTEYPGGDYPYMIGLVRCLARLGFRATV